ncbi:MAG: PadR family transcriptional regulator [Candidatus Aminicenantes bacterium]|nr:PadR family transcriptional regulator [Candidatus Aminicenantes bacterium]
MVSKALIAASTRPFILFILKRGENYGYKIIQHVKHISGGKLEWSDGMLYPVLHRLEKEGLIRSRWKLSEGGRMRKYYAITEKGNREMEMEKRQWLDVHEALTALWTKAVAAK